MPLQELFKMAAPVQMAAPHISSASSHHSSCPQWSVTSPASAGPAPPELSTVEVTALPLPQATVLVKDQHRSGAQRQHLHCGPPAVPQRWPLS